MLRKGLDTLGKALRETGQALDRAGLEALGSDKHKELCKFVCVCVCVCVCVFVSLCGDANDNKW